MTCSQCPIRSVPNHRTARKQNGRSRAVSSRYTPRADHPYSRLSFLNRCDNESEGSGELRCGVGLKGDLEEEKRLLGIRRVEAEQGFRSQKNEKGDGEAEDKLTWGLVRACCERQVGVGLRAC